MTHAEIIASAFIMGFAGSLHCVGMCGPLAFSLPVSHTNNLSRISGAVIYNAGRIFTYTILGILFGSFGRLFISTNWQSKLSIGLGIIILLYLFLPKKYFHLSSGNLISKPFMWLREKLGSLFKSKKYSSLFLIGILNGLLPCGLVYLALSSAVITAGPWHGAMFMSMFGAGTFPAMFAAVVAGNYLNQSFRLKISKAIPVLLTFMAVLLILRGMELGIPFISPVFDQHYLQAVSCH